jgi:hypothetical protein
METTNAEGSLLVMFTFSKSLVKENTKAINHRTDHLITISVVSFCLLLLQIFLTRVFSVITWYHIASLAISVSMFGLCLGGLTIYLLPNFFSSHKSPRNFFILGILFGVSISMTILFLSYIGRIFINPFGLMWLTGLIFVVCSIPFYLGGLLISLIFKDHVGHSGKLYAFDLFSAAVACAASILILKFVSIPQAISGLGALVILGTCILYGTHRANFKISAIASLFAILLLGTTIASSYFDSIQSWFNIRTGKHYAEFQRPLFEKWNAFSRISVLPNIELRPFGWGIPKDKVDFMSIKQYQLLIDGLAGTVLTAFDGDPSSLSYLKYDSVNLAHHIRHDADIFVVGVGGGRDILTSLVFNQKSVVGAEINESILQTLNIQFGELTGHLDKIQNVKFVNTDARSFLSGTSQKFDIIVMSLIDTFAATFTGAFSLSENYLYTKEAFSLFLQKVHPDGLISVSRWWTEDISNESYKLINLTVGALRDLGVSDPQKHIFVVKTKGRNSEYQKNVEVATLLFSPNPLRENDIQQLEKIANQLSVDIVISPNLNLQGLIQSFLDQKNLAVPGTERVNVTPPTDDKPFFFQNQELSSLNPFEMEKGPIRNLMAVIWLAAFGLLLLIFCDLRFNSNSFNELKYNLGCSIYFLLIGIAYLLIEIAQLQGLGAYLGHPVYALTTALFTFLAMSGFGSLVSYHYQEKISARASTSMLFLFLMTLLLTGYLTTKIIGLTWGLNLICRILIAIALLGPTAFFMGFLFPMGLNQLKSFDPKYKAWMWAINGGGSVLAGLSASVISTTKGIAFTYWTGSVLYVFSVMIYIFIISKISEGRLVK